MVRTPEELVAAHVLEAEPLDDDDPNHDAAAAAAFEREVFLAMPEEPSVSTPEQLIDSNTLKAVPADSAQDKSLKAREDALRGIAAAPATADGSGDSVESFAQTNDPKAKPRHAATGTTGQNLA